MFPLEHTAASMAGDIHSGSMADCYYINCKRLDFTPINKPVAGAEAVSINEPNCS